MKKLLAVIGVVLLIVPTVLALVFYNELLREESLRERLDAVEVTDEYGAVFRYSSDSASEDKAAFETLKSLKNLTEKSMSTRDDLVSLYENSLLTEDGPKCSRFYLKYVTNHGEYTAEIFLIDKENNGSRIAYLVPDDGSVLCFDDAAKKSLMACRFTYSIYNKVTVPTLTVGDRLVKYSSASWKVRTSNGEYIDVPCNDGSSAELETFASTFVFSQKPDAATVRVRDANDSELYNGDMSAFGSFTLLRSGSLTVDVTAFWYQKSDRDYYGTVTYTYTAYFTAEPRFELNEYEVQPGGTLLLSCINVPEDSQATAKTGDRTVTLYRNGENLYAFVAISYDTAPGTYSLDVTVSGKETKLTFTVTDKKFSTTAKVPQSMMPADRLAVATSEEALLEYAALVKSVSEIESGELTYDGALMDYQKSFALYKGYGLYIPFEAENKIIRNDGVIFTVRAGSTVPAMGMGKAAAVGECAYLGKYVVIDHGYGLRTWYTSLGGVEVEVGDTVEKGEKIATAGTGGISPASSMLVIVTVDGVPVSPYLFWESTRTFAK